MGSTKKKARGHSATTTLPKDVSYTTQDSNSEDSKQHALSGEQIQKEPHSMPDVFSKLPLELLELILSYLINAFSYNPYATGRRHWEKPGHHYWLDEDEASFTHTHPFLQLARCSKHLRNAVEHYSHSLLTEFSAVVEASTIKKPSKELTTDRGRWIRFVSGHCVFCGRRSRRHAIFQSIAFCCTGCDRQCFPTKITKTAALKRYKLKKEDLFAPYLLYGQGCGLRQLKYAVYMCNNTETTLFYEHDVKRRAAEVWGDLFKDGGVDRSAEGISQVKSAGGCLGLKAPVATSASKREAHTVLAANMAPRSESSTMTSLPRPLLCAGEKK